MSIKKFTDLIAWQVAYDLAIEIYSITENYPSSELFGLSNQLRRASISVSSNIAEGFKRKSIKEKLRFYSISLGSLSEIESQLIISKALGYLEDKKFSDLEGLIRRSEMLIESLNRHIRNA